MDLGDVKADERKFNEAEPNDMGDESYRRARTSLGLAASPFSSTDTLDRLLDDPEKNEVEVKEQGKKKRHHQLQI